MTNLFIFRDKMKAFYGKYDMYIIPVIKFFVTLTAMILINRNIGYMKTLKSTAIVAAISVISCLLPYGGICWVLAIVILAHVFSVSFEMSLIIGIFLLVTALLYYGFRPSDSFILILVPIIFTLKIPYIIPLLVGLGGSLACVIPVACGTMLYYILSYVNQNAGTLTNDSSVDITQRYVKMINGVMANKTMMLLIIAFTLTIMVVYLIHLLSVDYSWVIAICAGVVVLLLTIFIGDHLYSTNIEVMPLIGGALLAAVCAAVYNFFVFSVDYTRTEYTQFEDDDYYYYVKAVPKISMTAPDLKVRKYNAKKNTKKASNDLRR